MTSCQISLAATAVNWSQPGGGGGVTISSIAPLGIARRMISAIVTSLEISREIVSWF